MESSELQNENWRKGCGDDRSGQTTVVSLDKLTADAFAARAPRMGRHFVSLAESAALRTERGARGVERVKRFSWAQSGGACLERSGCWA